jgi:uncharacterized protein (TIGR03435 family)
MAFEEVTIRPAAASQPLAAGARGGGDGRPPLYGGREWCHPGNDEIQLDPRRWAVKNVRLFTLIAWAYGRCTTLSGFDRISGGPEWVKSDKWDIQALIPEGSNDPLPRGLYGAENEFVEGRSPKVQEMLKALLADRFKLALRHETKEVPVYVMSTTSDGPKFQGNQLFEGRGRPAPTDEFYRSQTSQEGVVTLTFINSPLASLVEALEMFSVDRPVLDRTGIGDKHTFRITWERDPASLAAPRSQRPPTPFRDLLKAFEQVGLQLQERKEPIDVIVIQHAEKPLEN